MTGEKIEIGRRVDGRERKGRGGGK